MKKYGVLMIGLAGVGMFGCAMDAPTAEEGEQAQDVQTETAEAAVVPTAHPDTFGQGHVIRLANTQLCLRPLNGSLVDAPLELAPCDFSAKEQNWVRADAANGWQFQNVASQKCLWAFGDVATTGTALGVLSCNIGGTNSPASNGIWTMSRLEGLTIIESLLGHKFTGFCLDDAAGKLQLSTCNKNQVSQIWEIGEE